MTETQNTPEPDEQKHCLWHSRYIAGCDACQLEYDRLKAQKDRIVAREEEKLRNEGRESVVLIRCLKCLGVPQQNRDEITGAECGGCIAKERDAALAELAEVKKDSERWEISSNAWQTNLEKEMEAHDATRAELAQERAKREEAELERAAFMISANNLQATCDHQQVTINALLTRRNEMESSLATLRAEVEKLRADSERLTWLLDYITQHGTDGIGELQWTIVEEEEGDALLEDRASLAFDRAALDAAKEAQ